MAAAFAYDNIEVVVAPAIGAVISQWVAYHLTELTGREVRSDLREKKNMVEACLRHQTRVRADCARQACSSLKTFSPPADRRERLSLSPAVSAATSSASALCAIAAVMVQDIASVPKLNALVNLPLQAWIRTSAIAEETCRSTPKSARARVSCAPSRDDRIDRAFFASKKAEDLASAAIARSCSCRAFLLGRPRCSGEGGVRDLRHRIAELRMIRRDSFPCAMPSRIFNPPPSPWMW